MLKNPEYYKKEKMGKWTGNIPREIALYEVNGKDLILPFGTFKEIWNIYPYGNMFRNDIKPYEPFFYESNITLYPYQEKAVRKALKARNGVIVMPCGSGKTQTALQLCCELGGRVLWLTHTQDLLNQSLNRAKSVFELYNDDYGTITGGKVNIGEIFTFATVQTMSKIDLTELKDTFNIIIVDECHKAIGSPTKVMQFYKVLSNLSARHKYGITATPKRADGLERSMYALLGEKICEISRTEVKNTTCKIEVYPMSTGFVPDMSVVLAGDGTLNYSSLIQNLIHDESRFDVVSKTVNVMGKGERTLVLANRVEYLERLHKEFIKNGGSGICLSGLSNTKTGKEARKQALKQLNNREIDCIFATYQLAKEGLDIPELRHLILATPEKDKTTVTQSVGRVGRIAVGKDKGIVVDFIDDFGMYIGWWKKRKNIYKSIDCEIIENE